MSPEAELVATLLRGILAADARLIAGCFAPDARLRALIPPGPVTRKGPVAAGELIASWFTDSEPLRLVDHEVDHVADRLHVSYRLEGTEAGADFTVQQQLYAEVVDDRLAEVTLLCSGFRPRTSTGSEAVPSSR